eukprot:407357-Pleurochrysis_carterae.AAC.9
MRAAYCAAASVAGRGDSHPRLLARAPADGDEAGLDRSDGPPRATVVALHEVEAIRLLQGCVRRLARGAAHVLAHVSAKEANRV